MGQGHKFHYYLMPVSIWPYMRMTWVSHINPCGCAREFKSIRDDNEEKNDFVAITNIDHDFICCGEMYCCFCCRCRKIHIIRAHILKLLKWRRKQMPWLCLNSGLNMKLRDAAVEDQPRSPAVPPNRHEHACYRFLQLPFGAHGPQEDTEATKKNRRR